MKAYLTGPHAPIAGEIEATQLEVQGELPAELRGTYVRNSSNPRFPPPGRYHWFDGDGLVHAVAFEDGRATYRCRYLRTRAYELESQAGHALWGGLLEPLDPRHPHGPIKDTANTDVIWHNGQVLATWWLSGTPMAVGLPELETLGAQTFGGALTKSVAAHPKVCSRTGELFFFGFNLLRRPYYHFGCVAADGSLRYVQDVDLPHAHVPHDIAITERYLILLDLPLGYERAALAQGKRKIGFDRSLPARFGIVSRAGGEVRWFELPTCYVYHTINAYEEGEEVVLYACRIEDPVPAELAPGSARLDAISLSPVLYRWRFNLQTGEAKGEALDDRATEFPRANDDLLTSNLRYAYHPRIAARDDLLFDGLIKYELATGETKASFDLPANTFLGEPSFAPRAGASADLSKEDEGWLVTITSDDERSELLVLEASDLGVVARAPLPTRITTGFHSCWAPEA